MLRIVMVVLIVMTMFLWLLSLLGAFGSTPLYSPWLAWFTCLFLTIGVFFGGGAGSLKW